MHRNFGPSLVRLGIQLPGSYDVTNRRRPAYIADLLVQSPRDLLSSMA